MLNTVILWDKSRPRNIHVHFSYKSKFMSDWGLWCGAGNRKKKNLSNDGTRHQSGNRDRESRIIGLASLHIIFRLQLLSSVPSSDAIALSADGFVSILDEFCDNSAVHFASNSNCLVGGNTEVHFASHLHCLVSGSRV